MADKNLLNSIPPPFLAITSLTLLQTIFFGANDACIPSANNGQHVPLATFKANIRAIATHPVIQAHDPKLVLVTPGPLEERVLEERNRPFGYADLNRFNDVTAQYAQAVREVGKELGVPVLDLWMAFQRRAGWREGEKWAGSRDAPANEVMRRLLHDGMYTIPNFQLPTPVPLFPSKRGLFVQDFLQRRMELLTGCRPSLCAPGVRNHVRGADDAYKEGASGSGSGEAAICASPMG
jgi:hypothetical protein